MNLKIKSLIYLLVCCCFLGCEQNIVVQYDPDPQTNFDALWHILDQKYCYFDTKNIDWNGVRTIYEPKATQATTSIELFDVLAQIIDTLQDGHVNLYSPFDISRCRGWFENYPSNFNESVIYDSLYLGKNYRIAGGFNYNTINQGNIGYMRYASFSSGFSSANFAYIDYQFKNCKGIIIDVRNNGGGDLDNSKIFASCFFKEKTLTGYMRHKTGFGHSDFSDMEPMYVDPAIAPIDWSDKKVVVLCNRRCYSATNNFIVNVLQAPHVTVIGGTTGGGGGLPLSSELPNGWMIRFSAVPMYDQNQQETEFGVDPHIFVTMKSTDVAESKDTLIEYAIALINN